jgi:hypothetical protein
MLEWSGEEPDLHAAMKHAYDACVKNTHCVMQIIDGDKVYERNDFYPYWDSQGWTEYI